ncbi:hypothetical protein BFJ69_g7843 [Fusarium oxysporum]|uniref:Uncharacterized protein n=1 Tax=Fusarium oxysporum TaxID=5507 RepID=A0A420N4X6_FUSOX|nr:hypothetical protein BFJ69_g7843 [Fusarium oxysporum]
MDEKPHTTYAVFVPCAGDDDPKDYSTAIGFILPWHSPGQRRQWQPKWLLCAAIVATVLFFAASTVGLYPGSICSQQGIETASNEHPASLADGSSIGEGFARVQESWDDMSPMEIPGNGANCPRNTQAFTQAAIQNAYDKGRECKTSGCQCPEYPKYFGNKGKDDEKVFPGENGPLREFPIFSNGDAYCNQTQVGRFRVVWRGVLTQKEYVGVIEKEFSEGNTYYSACTIQ